LFGVGMPDLGEPRVGHAALLNTFRESSLVQLRPVLRVGSRRELASVCRIVYAFDDAVDPAVAQSFFYGLFVRHAAFARVLLWKNHPHDFFRSMIVSKPRSPTPTVLRSKGVLLFHTPVSVRRILPKK